MKKYTVHCISEVVSLPIEGDCEYEIFLTFYQRDEAGSYPLTLTAEDVRDWFFPGMFDYTVPYGIHNEGQEPYDVIRSLNGKVESLICQMLNEGNSDYSEIVRPLEQRALKEWQAAHGD